MTIADMARLPPPPEAGPRRPRIALVDIARGAALVAMFVYHFAWDLSFFRLIETDIVAHAGWRWFAHAIAGSFLALVGASLVLATRQGFDRDGYLRRLALVAGAAVLVTAGTYLFMPDTYVFFGILHHIAVASVLALPFLALPTLAVAGGAITAFALPALVGHPVLDTDLMLWLGLSDRPIRSGDFVPLFPWFGCVLGGIVAARAGLALIGEERLAAIGAGGRPAALLATMGRHSLPIYLVHQPLFIALLSAWIWLFPAAVHRGPLVGDPQTRPFVEACMRTCVSNGQEPDLCREACECTADRLKRDNLWGQALSGQLSATERARVGEIARICTRGE
ncbi:MAG: heparan-alpha-glucosaminide N-acetyltransferase [Phreatobacter sp.]|uniref:DUF1624 domain-containing protein n=1 Tax=Phreatobacter sp. TaxID=1966341 RepID=UPI002732D02E|nr:heparan-alpha-glucosaminide N-acetyltransferase [Phreatobacter sp.]MDP2802354.1 heparan-alpha-glucosaminide N-acetyltransferase [Phreatobacter sp.]